MDPQEPVNLQVAEAAGTPPPKRNSFVMSFIPKKDLTKFLPIVLILFLVVTLPLAVILVQQRTRGARIAAAEEELLGPRENFFVRDGIPEDPQAAKARMLEVARANPTVSRGYLQNFDIPQADQEEENIRRLEDFLNQSPFDCEDVPEEDTSVVVNEGGNLRERFISRDDLQRFRERTGRPLRRCQLSRGQPILPPCGNYIQPSPPSYECLCERVTADKDLNNLTIGGVISFTGVGKSNDSDHEINLIKFIVKKNGTEMVVEEKQANFDHQEGDWRFYKADGFSYTIEEYGDYEVAIQVSCPQGWQD